MTPSATLALARVARMTSSGSPANWSSSSGTEKLIEGVNGGITCAPPPVNV